MMVSQLLCAVLALLLHVSQEQLMGSGSGISISGSGIGSGIGIGPPCPLGQFYCQNSSDVCVEETMVCDGKVDCPSGEDESVCSVLACNLDQYRCVSGDMCIPLYQVCDGVLNCMTMDDESSCEGAAGALPLNLFECTSTGQRIARASLCDGRGDCLNGEDEARCDRPVAQMLVPSVVQVASGGNVTLSCGSMGYPTAFITWERNLAAIPRNPRYTLSSNNGHSLLHIRDVGLEDAGRYHCKVVSPLHGSYLVEDSVLVQVTDASPSTCVAHNNAVYEEGSHYYDVRPVGIGSASQEAADVIFVVDESGSMDGEQAWIREEVQILDRMLKEKGVGAGTRRNQFALVGFSRNNPRDIFGITLTNLTSSSNFVEAARNLVVTGTAEDGYAAIDYALSNIATRPDTAKQIILVTDADRRNLRFDLDRDVIERRLRERQFTLNVVVNQGYSISEEDGVFALGITRTSGYVLDPFMKRLYSTVSAADVTWSSVVSFGTTAQDYVMLALNLNGAAWDLNQLREGGTFAQAFVNVFSDVKVEEMMGVFRYCFRCHCRSGREVCNVDNDVVLSNCSGLVPVLRSAVTPESVLVMSGEDLSFTCLVYSNNMKHPPAVTWLYPPQLQDVVVVDGDTLTVGSVAADANISCVVEQQGTGASSQAFATITIDSRCRLPDRSYLVQGDVRIVLVPRDSNHSRAADVVVLVDESGSMAEEVVWLSGMVELLDRALVLGGVGASERNNFGVVGFGGGCDSTDSALGRILLDDGQQMFTSAANISALTQGLKLGGRDEDGYSAIEIALRGYDFRNSARQFILITDEDRDVLSVNATRERLRAMLEDAGVQLNVAVTQQFLAGDLRALGVDSSRNAYLFDPSIRSAFVVESGAGASVEGSAYGSTDADYTMLAWELGGAAWDLSQLRQGGDVAKAFTNAFVHAKVVEIQSQLDKCLNCFCTPDGPSCEQLPESNFSLCMAPVGVPPPNEEPVDVMIEGEDAVTIGPSRTMFFSCVVNASAVIRWTMDGRNLPANARVQDVGGFVSQLIIRSPTEENAGVYVCSAHSQSGFYSGRDTLRITFYDPRQDLNVKVSPSQALLTTSENFTLTCTSSSSSTFSWLLNHNSLPPHSEVSSTASSSVLQLVFLERAYEGMYTCTATRRDLAVEAEASAYIQVRDPVLSLLVEPERTSIMEGEPVSVFCSVECFCPGVTPVWRREGNMNLSDLASVSNNGSGTVLYISSALESDSGRYICSAELNDTTAFSEHYLTVTNDNKFVAQVLGDSEVELTNGSYYSLLCQTNKAVGNFTWQFNNIPIQVETQQVGVVPANVEATEVSVVQSLVSIRAVSEVNAGTYQCLATSADGSQQASSQVLLSVV